MLTLDQATAIVLERTAPPSARAESVALADLVGRVAAEAVAAGSDLPPFARSTMDGFAVRAADAISGAELAIAGEAAAGRPAAVELLPGQAIRIFTGAAVPRGADAVVMVEATSEAGGRVRLAEGARPGQNVARLGEDVRRGDAVVTAGERLASGHVALLASLGAVTVRCLPRPRVAILATGTELVPPASEPPFGSIRESNGAMLRALVRLAGAEPVDLGIVADDRGAIRERSERGVECDAFLLSGGSSVGDYDFTPAVLADLGVAAHFDRVALKPGKPTLFGTRGECAVFGLPGNPISAFVTFHLFVRPALAIRAGAGARAPVWWRARLAASQKRIAARDQVLPAALTLEDGRPVVRFTGWHGSGDVTCMARANALLRVPMGEGAVEAGCEVAATPLDAGRAGDVAWGAP